MDVHQTEGVAVNNSRITYGQILQQLRCDNFFYLSIFVFLYIPLTLFITLELFLSPSTVKNHKFLEHIPLYDLSLI